MSIGRRVLGAIIRAPFTGQAWTEALYTVVGLPLAVLGFVFVVVSLAVGITLSVTLVGLPLLALSTLGARWLGRINRWLAQALWKEWVEPPRPFESSPGLLGWLRSALFDGVAWRARLYLVVKFPLGVGAIMGIGFLWGLGLSAAVYLSRWLAAPVHPHTLFPFTWTVNAWEQALVIGLAAVLAAPWFSRALVWLDLRLLHLLLGRSHGSARERELEEARSQVVEDSAARLRQIERDLHDGAQVRLTALAMNLGQIKEDLEGGGDGSPNLSHARELVDAAHRNAKDALVELRDLARGIHPPVLDTGLDAALTTLAANSAVQVSLSTELPRRPSSGIETIAYFCIAELLANVAKHSSAEHAWVQINEQNDRLLIRVSDDGTGGAHISRGGGLAGLADRVRMVDGAIVIKSPPGGPTAISVELPMQV